MEDPGRWDHPPPDHRRAPLRLRGCRARASTLSAPVPCATFGELIEGEPPTPQASTRSMSPGTRSSSGEPPSLRGFGDLVGQARLGDLAAMDQVLGTLMPHLDRLARYYGDSVQSAAHRLGELCSLARHVIGSHRKESSDDEAFATIMARIDSQVASMSDDPSTHPAWTGEPVEPPEAEGK